MSYIGTNKPVAIADYSEASPIGTLIYFAGTQAPPGYLACQGQEVAQSAYPELYAAIGDTWNNTNGAPDPQPGNFRLPPGEVDGLGLYLRNTGATNGSVGTYQVDVFKEHSHTVFGPVGGTTGTSSFTGGSVYGGNDDTRIGLAQITGDPTETRPRTITTLLCIKATYSRYLGDIGGVPVNSVGESQLIVSDLQVAGLLPTAWCVFDGTLLGANPPLAGYNIASVERVSTGKYSLNFESPVDNLLYAINITSASFSSNDYQSTIPRTVNSFGVYTRDAGNNPYDCTHVGVIIFGGRA